jgi:hypothetical protein
MKHPKLHPVILVACLAATLMLPACEKSLDDTDCTTGASITATSSLAQDQQLLETLFGELVALSGSSSCNTGDSWRITPYGALACGGPAGYLAYKTNMDEACLLKKVAHFTSQQQQFNTKHSVVSPCIVFPLPKAVRCEDGKPVFQY